MIHDLPIEVEWVRRLEVSPGDVVLVKLRDRQTLNSFHNIAEHISAAFKKAGIANVLIMDGGVESVLILDKSEATDSRD